MKIPCEIVRDLLPLYVDGVCSEESKKAVEEHLQDCKLCREELNLMNTDIQSIQSQAVEEEPVKAAAAAWKRGKHKAFLKGGVIALVIAGLVAAILCHCLIPVTISPKSFKTGDIFQHRVFRWDMPELAVRLIWGKQMEVNPTGITSTEYDQLLWSRRSCMLNGERGDMAFYFRDDKLIIMEMMFQNTHNNEWSAQLLEELQEYYGPETRKAEKDGKVLLYIWELGESNMIFSPGDFGSPFIYLFKSAAPASTGS